MTVNQAFRVVGKDLDDAAIGNLPAATLPDHPFELAFEVEEARRSASRHGDPDAFL